MIQFVDLKEQYLSIKEEIDEAIKNVLDKGWFILGEEVEAFEREFAEYCGVDHGVGVGSGTEALHLALLAVGIKPGDEVITVANTAVPTVAAIDFAGAKPVFVDIDPDTYTMDPNRIEEVINEKTKVILPVHLYGHPADLDPILDIAEKYNLFVVEDCAQAHGAIYKGRKVGSLGNLGCFSFYPSKNLGAYGDGGMVITSNPKLAERIKLLRNYGQTKRYYHQIKGFNSRLDEIQAAILRIKFKKLDKWNALRRKNAQIYNNSIKSNQVVLPEEKQNCQHVYHLFVVRSKRRDELKMHFEKNGIMTEIHYPIPIHQQKAFSELNYELPITEEYAQAILSLPIFPEIKKTQINIVINCLRNFEHKYAK